MHIISKADTKEAEETLSKRTDSEAARIKRFMSWPDLSRTPGSPLHEMVERVSSLPDFKGFDEIEIPEIIPTDILFDLFDFPADHPARSKSDTYYIDEKNVLRTHDTVFWYYYLNQPEIKERLARKQTVGALCYGKVYRKDEIDRNHMNVFHQMGGWYLVPDSAEVLGIDTLKKVLSDVVRSVFGDNTEFRINVDSFPYTDPSLEVEVKKGDEWVEILGGGMPKKSVLKNLGLEGYNGWAFGFGLERLAIIGMELPDIRLLWSDDERVKKQLKLGIKFKEVSKFPPITRDISFIVTSDFVPNNYFDLIRDIGGELVEEVKLLDKYENEAKFGAGKVSYTYHITYRSIHRTLTDEEVNTIQKKIYDQTAETYKAELR